jgi:hypothetical protein
MTTDVRTLLHGAADTPTRDPDITRALATAHARRRRARGLGALAAVVVIALGVGALLVGGGGDGSRVAIGPRQGAVEIPSGWRTIHADPGLSMSIPSDWVETDTGILRFESIGYHSLGAGSAPGLLDPRGCEADLPLSFGTVVLVQEVPSDPAVLLRDPDISPPLVDRPTDFTSSEPLLLGYCDTPNAIALREWLIRDQSRRSFMLLLYTRAADGDDSDQVTLGERVLNTLRVEPLGAPPTTTVPLTTTPAPPSVALPTITTLPTFVPSTDDERAIQALVERWLGGDHTEESQRAVIEDAESILDALRQGLAQYPDRLPYYTGSLDALAFEGPDRASIRFTLYYKGQPAYTRDGDVVRVDGQWKVTRATECAFLAQGGIACPPPS